MSVQIAKSTSGSSGRLSQGGTSGPTTRAARTQSSDSEKETSNRDMSSNASKTVQKTDKGDNATDIKKSVDNNDNKPKGENKTTGNSNSAKDKMVDQNKKDDKKQTDEKKHKDDKKQTDDKKQKDDKKQTDDKKQKDDKKQANVIEENKDVKANGPKGEEMKKSALQDKSDIKLSLRESPRLKDVKEKEENQEKRKGEAKTEKEDKKSSIKSDEDKQKQTKKDKDERATPHREKMDREKKQLDSKAKLPKQPETPKKNEKKAKDLEPVTPSKSCTELEYKNAKETQQAKLIAKEVEIIEVINLDDDMESLVFDPEFDQNGPTETSTPGKILKMKTGPPSSGRKPSELKVYDEEKQIPSASIKASDLQKEKQCNEEMQSSESIQQYQTQIKKSAPSTSFTSDTDSTERSHYVSSLRSITGRRSLRPMKEYSFQSTYRESYRKINTELDYTSSSMNVTVGSEVPQNDSTFSFFTRAKKRERTPPPPVQTNEVHSDAELSPKSPKRARMDFTGILGFVASPLTLLRAKFSKTKIQCSTPNGKVTPKEEKEEEEEEEEEGVENVSVIATEEIASEMAEDVIINDVETADNDDDEDSIKDIEIEEEENTDVDVLDKKELNVAPSTDSLNKRRMCSVM